MNNPADETPIFSERAARYEDAQAAVLAFDEHETIQRLAEDHPTPTTLEFIEALLREVMQHAGRFDWNIEPPSPLAPRALVVQGEAIDPRLRGKTVQIALLDDRDIFDNGPALSGDMPGARLQVRG